MRTNGGPLTCTTKTSGLLAVAVVVASIGGELAQAQSYVFEQAAANYVPLQDEGSSPCVFSNGRFTVPELHGEVFRLFDTQVVPSASSPFVIGEIGYLSISSGTEVFSLDGLVGQMQDAGDNSEVRYTVLGGPGAHELVVEFRDREVISGAGENRASWQVRIDQATGVLSAHFGPSVQPPMPFGNAIGGPYSGVIHSENDLSVIYEKLYLEQDPADPEMDAQADLDFDVLFGLPEPGTIYRFIPSSDITGIEADESAHLAFSLSRDGDVLRVKRSTGSVFATELSIFDMSGQLIMDLGRIVATCEVPLAGLAAGTYLVRLTGERSSEGHLFTVN